MLEALGRVLARYLTQPRTRGVQPATSKPEALAAALRVGDVLLVEGNTRISSAIKYLTQSSWSHAALCVGRAPGVPAVEDPDHTLIEADVRAGVRAVPLSTYASLHTRICRPVGLTPEEVDRVVAHAVSRLGHQYDLKNVFDLARYLIRTPPIPTHWRRTLLTLGSGDPTRAICSSMIAEAFQSIPYPILPLVFKERSQDPDCVDCEEEVLQVRPASLMAPRDFDVSPYFAIVKPAIQGGFDPHGLKWAPVIDRAP
ncbi:MAG: hypothetical protein DHS20C21_14650 [Gemmatimonadota bacterium]|nr:MAG: hypothetical protein DHS20C21_14650 [Gemmatimonadota bacterium]